MRLPSSVCRIDHMPENGWSPIVSAVFAIVALLWSALLGRGDRRTLLLTALAVFASSNALAAASSSYTALFGARVLMAGSCALVAAGGVMVDRGELLNAPWAGSMLVMLAFGVAVAAVRMRFTAGRSSAARTAAGSGLGI